MLCTVCLNATLLAASLLVLAAPLGAAAPNAPPVGLRTRLEQPRATVRIVCLGDSITGVYEHTGGKRAYPELLHAELRRQYPEATVDVINAGLSGHKSGDGLTRLPELLDPRPDLVVVKFGMNDCRRITNTAPATDLGTFRNNLIEIVNTCRAAGTAITLCSPNTISDSAGDWHRADLERFAEVVREVSREFEAPCLDLYATFERLRRDTPLEWSLLMSDEIHPNLLGHALIAREILRAVLGAPSTPDVLLSPPDPLRRIHAKLSSDQAIRILGLAPYSTAVAAGLRAVYPDAMLEEQTRLADDETPAAIQRQLVDLGPLDTDLIVVPLVLPSEPIDTVYIRHCSQLLNTALGFHSYKEWDCLAVIPFHTAAPAVELAQRIAAGKDIPALLLTSNEARAVDEAISAWTQTALRDAIAMER